MLFVLKRRVPSGGVKAVVENAGKRTALFWPYKGSNEGGRIYESLGAFDNYGGFVHGCFASICRRSFKNGWKDKRCGGLYFGPGGNTVNRLLLGTQFEI